VSARPGLELSSELLVGIDLGTTHTAVAVAESATTTPEIVPLTQWVSAGQVADSQLLPSVLFAEPGHAPNPSFTWDDATWIVGAHAQRRARELPARGVVSAKSWLCNESVDREAAILPWARATTEGDATATPRVSPVEASTRVLRHVFHQLYAKYGSALTGARVVLAIPASFDQVARQLTLKAASAAGFEVELVEEPQAAFQDVVRGLGAAGLEALLGALNSKLVLIVDVGGGTTDLALMRVTREAGTVRGERVAVGRHLLLGGDNLDLALAQIAEKRLNAGSNLVGLSALEFAQLLLTVREAKERLLGEDPPETFPIALAAAGSALVGSTRRAELTRSEVERLLFDGFLPEITDLSQPPARTGLLGFGLPFERDPAISRHVARFVARHAPELGAPDAVLFNGGLFRSEQAAARLVDVLSRWLGQPIAVIPNPHPDLAVARGAVAYAQALLGHGFAVQSRSAHGYYIGVGGSETPRALCVVPRGAAEGVVYDTAQQVGLTLGRASRFDLYASDTRRDSAGTWIALNPDEFHRLPRLTAALEGAPSELPQVVPVRLAGQLSAVGTLEIAAVELDATARRHQLAFELRGASDARAAASTSKAPTSEARPSEPPTSGVKPSSSLVQALDHVDRVFGKKRSDVGERAAKDLVRELERLLGPRREWELPTLRALADALLVDVRARRRSADHERTFFYVAGYCLRPGFGHALDAARIERFAPLFTEGLSFDQERKHWEAFLIAWRRVTPGLAEPWQSQIRDWLDPFIAPSEHKLKKPKRFRPQGDDDILSLCSWLERVAAERRGALGAWLLERTWTSRDPVYWDWIGRVGARVPVYASAHQVVVPRLAERWVEHLLSENWDALPNAARVAVSLARLTEDRERNLSTAARESVAQRLRKYGLSPEMVLDYVPLAEKERSDSYGDDLPTGFSLL
jgi:molecular chaperone DnaK (HSP70)